MQYRQFTITIPEPYRDALGKKLIGLGSLGVADHGETLIAYFPETISHEMIEGELDIVQTLLERMEAPVAIVVEHSLLQDADWNESWKKSFKPVNAGLRFTILPPWEGLTGERVPLIIDPGMAFGTGHHETTRSCIVLMERYTPAVNRDRFLDLGTGTGLLAIAAGKLGFTTVIGIDTDPLAIEASRKNMMLNGSASIEFHEGDIASAAGTFDMIAANLISGTLITLAVEIATRLRTSGVAILSGILIGQDDEVAAAMQRAGLVRCERLQDGKWVSLACRR